LTDNNQKTDKDEALKKLFKLMLESLMEGERTAVLGYGKHDYSGYGTDNSRNGYYKRDLLTGLGFLENLDIPRDRLGEFTPELLDKWQRATKPMDKLVMSLYAKGMTTRDINSVVSEIYGKTYSPQQVTLITQEIEEERKAWEGRPLKPRYTAVFIDALFVKLRRGETVSADAVYAVSAIDDTGYRDILGIYVGAAESANVWKEILSDLKERGIKEVLLFVSDGLTGLETVIHEEFPRALVQLCVVHQVRNTLNHVRPKDKDKMALKLKEIYKSKTLSEAKERLIKLNDLIKHGYPRLLVGWFDKLEYLMQFLIFPEYLQPHLYSTNWLERLNKDFRKVLKNKNSMPTEDSVRNLLYLKIRDLTGRYERQRLNGFVAYQVDLELLWQKQYGDNRFTQDT
jgi:transposase-like protein